jgi:hypothetical protein
MLQLRLVRFRRMLSLGLVVAMVAMLVVALGSNPVTPAPAGAETPSPTVNVTASPTTGLNDGSVITVNVDAGTTNIYQIDARLCRGADTYDFDADFNPTQGGKCMSSPVGAMAVAKRTVSTAPPNKLATLSYTVGIGSNTFTMQNSQSTTVACGPLAPQCKLVLRLTTNASSAEYKSFLLSYTGQATAPDAPTSVTASAPNPASGGATVAWTAPVSDGGSAITSYTVTAAPGGATCTSNTGSPINPGCTITGLTNGTPYTFTATATNGSTLISPASVASAAFIPGGAKFTALTPIRALDTRNGPGTPVGPGVSLPLAVAGSFGVPADATAVVMNVTVTDPTVAGYVSVYPDNASVPLASNLNFVPGLTVPNLVTVGIGTGGGVKIFNANGTTHVIADIVGYYKPDTGSGLTSLTPVRALDTRNGPGTPVGTSSSITLPITTHYGVPADATAVVLNVTVTAPTASGYLTVYPDSASTPLASNLNFVPGMTVPNLVTVGIGSGGGVKIFNANGTAHVIADVVGYYSPSTSGARFFPVTPIRSLDTRNGTGGAAAKIPGGGSINLTVAGRTGIPATGVNTALLNLTLTNPVTTGYMTVYPAGVSAPLASNLNFVPGQTVPNLVLAKLGTGGAVSIFNSSGSTDAIADVVGFFG